MTDPVSPPASPPARPAADPNSEPAAEPTSNTPTTNPPATPARVQPNADPVLPRLTSDESDAGWGDWREQRDDDERFLREVPPHHGTC